jgi:transposase
LTRARGRGKAATHTDVAFRVIAAGLHPDHSVISEFRRAHRTALEKLYLHVLKLCQKGAVGRA